MSISPRRPKCSAVPRPRSPEHAGGVRVVDHQHRIVPAAELDQVRQRRDRALHREHAVGDHELRAAVPGGGELRVQIRQVRVLVDRGLAFGDRLGEPGGVDDRGVVQLIADHDVLLPEQGAGDRLVRVPRAHEAERGAGAHQPRARRLERPVHGVGAADEPDGRGPRAPAVEPRLAGRDHFGLRAQAEVVVGGQDDDLPAALHRHPRGLRAIEEVEALVDAVADELLQLALEPVIEGVAHAATSRITLPAWPSLITWMASAMDSSGKRWVMTGRGSSWPARRKRRISSQVWYILRPVTP